MPGRNPAGEWMPAVIAAADKRLQQKRQHVPDAGGMVIASDQTTARAYAESKLYVTALAFAVARCRPEVLSHAVNPGWVATKMGGAHAPDDFEMGYRTQTWLAVSDDAPALVSGRYWFHRQPQTPANDVLDPHFQDRLMARLAELSGVSLF